MIPCLGGMAVVCASAAPFEESTSVELLARFESDGRFTLSPDERFVLLARAPIEPVLLDLVRGAAVDLPADGRWRAGSFASDSSSLWCIENGGSVRMFALPSAAVLAAPEWRLDAEASAAIAPVASDGWHDLIVAPDLRHLAWSRTLGGQRCAGVVELPGGRVVARFDSIGCAAVSPETLDWIAFSGDGAELLLIESPHAEALRVLGHEAASVVAFDLASAAITARAEPFVSLRTPGFAALERGFAVATRPATGRFTVARFAGPDSRGVPLIEQARGGHFIDLFVAPGGHQLCEWDFEERREGIVVVDLTAAAPPRTIAPGELFLGFASAPEAAATLEGRSACDGAIVLRGDGSLMIRSLADGGPTMAFELERGFVPSAARWCTAVQRLVVAGERSLPGGGRSREVQVWRAVPRSR